MEMIFIVMAQSMNVLYCSPHIYAMSLSMKSEVILFCFGCYFLKLWF